LGGLHELTLAMSGDWLYSTRWVHILRGSGQYTIERPEERTR